MKLSQTKQTIDAYADGLQASEAGTVADKLRAVASFLGEFGDQQMSNLVRRGPVIGRQSLSRPRTGGNSVGAEVAAQLDLLGKILASGGAKKELTKDLASLGELLRGFADSDTLPAAFDKLRDAMKPEPVEQQIIGFIARLKADTRTANFEATFAELAASPLKREHVVAIALSVYGGIKKSTSRKDALAFIRRPHDAYTSAKRGIDATGGRSAA